MLRTPPDPAGPETSGPAAFTDADAAAVYRAMRLRRDMRHFRPDPVPPDQLARLLRAAHTAPSVGYMQPWRFVRVADPGLRRALHGLVEDERRRTAEALGERRAEFLRLKVEGIVDCGEVLVVALTDGRERYVFGRRTLPEMDVASAACAIQNLWLAARVEGLGLGWVSIFDPEAVARLLGMPAGARPLAILCLGAVDGFYERPMLEERGWDERRRLADLVWEDGWGRPVPPEVRDALDRQECAPTGAADPPALSGRSLRLVTSAAQAQEFGDALSRVSRAAKAAAGEALRELGVHTGQNFLLDELRREDELTPGALAQRIGVDVSTITRTAQRMEAAGLVRRLPDPSDARLVRVALTDEGRAAAERLPAVLGAVYERLLAPLPAVDREALVALLRRLVDGLDT